MKIQNFPKSQLRQNEWLDTGRAIEKKIVEAGPETLGVETVFGTFQARLQDYDDSLVKITKSVFTAEMANMDKTRDERETGLLDQIRVAATHFDEAKRAAGQRLMVVADRFRNTTRMSFNDQTGMVTNLIQKLRSDEFAADVTTLGLTEWVDELEAVNDRCAELADERRKETGARNATLKAKDTRPAFEAAYDALVERLNALALVNGEEKYAELFRWWNAMIDEYRVAISLRGGKGTGGKTEGGDSDQPTPEPNPDDEGTDLPFEPTDPDTGDEEEPETPDVV